MAVDEGGPGVAGEGAGVLSGEVVLLRRVVRGWTVASPVSRETLILSSRTVTTTGVIFRVKFLFKNQIFLSVLLFDGGQGVHIVLELSPGILLLLGVSQPPLEALDKLMVGDPSSIGQHQLPH